MRSIAVVGVADPRHRLFCEPLVRHRAGIRLTAFCEPSAEARDAFARHSALPAFDDLEALLAGTDADLFAVSGADATATADALRTGRDVVATAPVATDPDGLDAVEQALSAAGAGRLLTLHPWRGHPAARLARELVADGGLGDPDGGLLVLPIGLAAAERLRVLADGIDQFQLLTDASTADDLEVVEDPDIVGPAGIQHVSVQLTGSRGALEWRPATGMMIIDVDDRQPRQIPCGPPSDEAAWTLTQVLRATDPDAPSGPHALRSTRAALRAAGELAGSRLPGQR